MPDRPKTKLEKALKRAELLVLLPLAAIAAMVWGHES